LEQKGMSSNYGVVIFTVPQLRPSVAKLREHCANTGTEPGVRPVVPHRNGGRHARQD